MTEKELIEDYFAKAKDLEERYPNRTFRNHCYWRIALDNVLEAKWDTMIQKPAYQNLSPEQLNKVLALLDAYLVNESLLLEHNQISLAYRRK